MLPVWLWGKTVAMFDLETDYIPTTQLFCNSVSILTVALDGSHEVEPAKVYTQYWTPNTHGSLMDSISIINKCDYMSAHNLMGFDKGEVKRHLGVDLLPIPLDTLILAKLIFSKDDLMAMDPQLGVEKSSWGSYGLKAFGQRMGDHKLDYTDFSHLNQEMMIYCDQDTNLAMQFLIFLLEKDTFPLMDVVTMEHKAAGIIYEQTRFGFYLDITKTRELNTTLLTEKGELARELAEIFSPKFLRDGAPKQYVKPSKVRKYLPNKHYKGKR